MIRKQTYHVDQSLQDIFNNNKKVKFITFVIFTDF